MRQVTKNQSGYALLIVLFLIVFIMTVSAVFLRGSISNAKQEIRTDKKHLSYMAAEAGVDFMKIALINEYYSKEETLDLEVKRRIAATNKNKTVEYEEIQKDIALMLEGYLSDRIKIELNKKHELINNYSYQLTEYKIVTNSVPGEIVVNGIINGMKLNNESKKLELESVIEYTQKFVVPNYNPADLSNGNGESGLLGLPNFKGLYPSSINEPSCPKDKSLISEICTADKSSNFPMIDKSTLYFPNGYYVGKHLKGITASDFFINSSMNVGHHMQFIDDSTFKINGPLSITHHMQDIIDTNFIINGSMSVGHQMQKIKNSSIAINGSLSVGKQMQNIESSIIYIENDLNVQGKLEIEGKSLVCIGGSINVTKKIDIADGSIVYYAGNLKNNQTVGKLIKLNSKAEMASKCKLSSGTVVWSKPIIENVNYR